MEFPSFQPLVLQEAFPKPHRLFLSKLFRVVVAVDGLWAAWRTNLNITLIVLSNYCSPQTRHLALPLKLFPFPWRWLMICYSRLFMDGLWVTSSNLCQSQPLNCSWVSGNLPNASFFAKLIDGWTTTVMSSCAVLCTTGVSIFFRQTVGMHRA